MKGENLLAFIGGAVIGAAAAIIFAPSSGRETREKIKDSIGKECKSFKEKIMQEEEKENSKENINNKEKETKE